MSNVNDNKYASLNSLKIFLDNINLLMNMHNISMSSHNDMRVKIEEINTRLTTLADCDDETLDQISEIVAYVKDNRELIEQITTAKVSVSDLMNLVYPIGSIYMSVNNISPSIFLGGTWEQIQDTFLLASGNNYIAGSTGGESEHILTIDEMPSHNHKLKTDIDSPNYNITWSEWFEYTDGWTQEAGKTEAPATHTTLTGGDKPHNNMPPYLVVYMWKRTA